MVFVSFPRARVSMLSPNVRLRQKLSICQQNPYAMLRANAVWIHGFRKNFKEKTRTMDLEGIQDSVKAIVLVSEAMPSPMGWSFTTNASAETAHTDLKLD
jgi:hypothetical protein